eukprot:2143387-Rhodomonas_salina.1
MQESAVLEQGSVPRQGYESEVVLSQEKTLCHVQERNKFKEESPGGRIRPLRICCSHSTSICPPPGLTACTNAHSASVSPPPICQPVSPQTEPLPQPQPARYEGGHRPLPLRNECG